MRVRKITYPKNNSQVRRIITQLNYLLKSLNITAYNKASHKEKTKLFRVVNELYRNSKDKENKARKEFEEEKAKFHKMIDNQTHFLRMVEVNGEMQFHNRFSRGLKEWLEKNNMPKI